MSLFHTPHRRGLPLSHPFAHIGRPREYSQQCRPALPRTNRLPLRKSCLSSPRSPDCSGINAILAAVEDVPENSARAGRDRLRSKAGAHVSGWGSVGDNAPRWNCATNTQSFEGSRSKDNHQRRPGQGVMHKKTTACTYNALLPALCFRVHQHVPRRLLLRAVPHLHALPVTDAEHARRLGVSYRTWCTAPGVREPAPG
jgi:hypothetical protein